MPSNRKVVVMVGNTKTRGEGARKTERELQRMSPLSRVRSPYVTKRFIVRKKERKK